MAENAIPAAKLLEVRSQIAKRPLPCHEDGGAVTDDDQSPFAATAIAGLDFSTSLRH